MRLEDISCATAVDCVAVGYYRASVNKTLIERLSGGEWQLQTSKDPSTTDNRLKAISCPSSSYCMAAGYYEKSIGEWVPLTESWSGGEWTQPTAPVPGGAINTWLTGVSCISASACTAVGEKLVSVQPNTQQTLAEGWNGSVWTIQATPTPEVTSVDVNDVSCTSSTSCTMVGNYTDASAVERPMALAKNGSGWSMQSPPMSAGDLKAHPYGVSCVVSRGCELVGFRQTGAGVFDSLAEGYWRGPPPSATTNAASAIGDNGATLVGAINPNGSPSSYYFEYGTSTAYGSKTAEGSAGSGSSPVEGSQAIGGLIPNTTYHYRVVATNENPDPSFGADQTFRTSGAPTASIGAGTPNPATGKEATLNATINPDGHATTYQFEYGTTSGVYTATAPAIPASAGGGTSAVPGSQEITGLNRNTKYFFRASATNSSGNVKSGESSFTTPDTPAAVTSPASEVTANSAKLSAVVTPRGLVTKYWFEYGTTLSYGSKAPLSPGSLGAAAGSTTVNQLVSGLQGKTLYHYRVAAENQLGTTFGSDVTFTTP